MMERWDADLSRLIDHTLLSPSVVGADVESLCRDATVYGFAAVVVPPFYVPVAARLLTEERVAVCSVVSFPLGWHAPSDKALGARRLIEDGAGEIDIVMNVGAFLDGSEDVVVEETERVAEVCGETTILKVIIETACLDDEQIGRASRLVAEHGADFVKTSTGFGKRGATVADVELIKRATKGGVGIKAAGGIRTRDFALDLVAAGATRLGCSTSLDVICVE